MSFEKIWVVDFGGQYNQLIARRVRELSVYSEVVSYRAAAAKIRNEGVPSGVILTGGGDSVYAKGAPKLPADVLGAFVKARVPVLGICYGMQVLAEALGGRVEPARVSEYGRTRLDGTWESGWKPVLFSGVRLPDDCWMSHTDAVSRLPRGAVRTASTSACRNASFEIVSKGIYAVQFHPEVHHTPFGQKLLGNFVYKICRCGPSWTMAGFIQAQVDEIRERVGSAKVLCALSGGVDSTVAAALVQRAVGDNLYCFFVDHGLLRQGEAEQVMDTYARKMKLNVTKVNASGRFLRRLKGVSDPERKRKIIGEEFIRVFEEQAARLNRKAGGIDYLLQGTIYPDVVESGAGGHSKNIKSHHNVGGLPKDMKVKLIEPLRLLFKDEVRKLGEELGLDRSLVWRQPFPGPGLAIRILGDVTREKLRIVRESDAILREEIDAYNERVFDENGGFNPSRSVWQYFTVLPNIRSVGVMGDGRTYEYAVGVRAVHSVDGMTSDWARLPHELLETIASRIVNEVAGVNRVLYDLTSKPPGTIEFE
jgi:GMP synthase (glutamine-hydrolysing)